MHQNLYGLTEITIPSKVTEIAKSAFAGTAIKSLTIPASVTTVGEQAFGECQKLETVRYSGKVIGDRMFVRCIKLKNFTITKSTTGTYRRLVSTTVKASRKSLMRAVLLNGVQ